MTCLQASPTPSYQRSFCSGGGGQGRGTPNADVCTLCLEHKRTIWRVSTSRPQPDTPGAPAPPQQDHQRDRSAKSALGNPDSSQHPHSTQMFAWAWTLEFLNLLSS